MKTQEARERAKMLAAMRTTLKELRVTLWESPGDVGEIDDKLEEAQRVVESALVETVKKI